LQLNKQQQQAIDTVYGPILILAGAGSGKTRVLTNKIAHLLQNKHAGVSNILAVTFTNKAAAEMKERISQLLNTNEFLPWVGTFHAISLKILKRHAALLGYDQSFTIYDTSDQLSAVKAVMKQMNIDIKQFNPRSILGLISGAKNEMISAQAYARFASGLFQETAAKIYPKYQNSLKANSAMDFDDLIMLTVKLLEENPDILERYQNQFKFILIDEYQDTNHAQYKLTGMLASKHKNICVVGDDAQSIYSFRGATIENILNFEKDYPDATVIKLEQNYRSTQTILDASNEIISKNENQKQKNLWTENSAGDKIVIYEGYNEKEEADWIAGKIDNLLENNVNASDIAILYRTNAQSRSLEEAMLRNNISYKIVGNVKFYDRKEVKDVVAYLKVLYNIKDNLSLKRIINTPRRGLGPKTVANTEMMAASKMQSLFEFFVDPDRTEHLSSSLENFAKLLAFLYKASETINITELIDIVMDKSGYFDMLNDGTLENETRLDNIKELKSLASRFSELDPREGLTQFLEEISLIEGFYEDQEKQDAQITMMTIHSAKGLEFDHVFVAGMEEGIFPHSRTFTDPTELEEERRLAYVAYTRAKRNLYLTHTESRTYFGVINNNPLSRFVHDIPSHLVDSADTLVGFSSGFEEFIEEDDSAKDISFDFEKGEQVMHDHFGPGIILDFNDDTVQVQFRAGVKELALEYCNLKKLS
jgi:DNA helicase II / ATP-dependent DNA helicase PcrA